MLKLVGLKGLKKKDLNAPFLRRFLRYVSTPIAILLSKTKVTPNQVSVVYFILYLIAAYLYSLNNYLSILVASILVFLGLILDRVDGSLARIKKVESDYGYWFDKTFDNIGKVFLFMGVTMAVYKQTENYFVWLFGLLGITSSLLITIQYTDFMDVFKFGKEAVEKERMKSKVLKQFFYNEPHISFAMVIFGLFNKLYWFILIAGVYGTLCMIIHYLMLTSKIKRGIKDKPQATQDERHDG